MKHSEDMIYDYKEGTVYDRDAYEFHCRRCDDSWGQPMHPRYGEEYIEKSEWCYEGQHEAHDREAVAEEGWDDDDDDEQEDSDGEDWDEEEGN